MEQRLKPQLHRVRFRWTRPSRGVLCQARKSNARGRPSRPGRNRVRFAAQRPQRVLNPQRQTRCILIKTLRCANNSTRSGKFDGEKNWWDVHSVGQAMRSLPSPAAVGFVLLLAVAGGVQVMNLSSCMRISDQQERQNNGHKCGNLHFLSCCRRSASRRSSFSPRRGACGPVESACFALIWRLRCAASS